MVCRSFYHKKNWALLFFALAVTVGCSSNDSSTKSTLGDRVSPIYEGPAEASYCSTSVTFTNPITITGKAQYRPREKTAAGLGAEGPAKPIRRAEVRILDAAGSVKQCSVTDANGNFSFTLPKDGNDYIISVSSRANNSYLKATVFVQPETNFFYALKKTVTADSSKDIGTMTARATGQVLSGAFNILDQLLNANDYLRTQVGDCSATYSGCNDFTVAEKIKVYWEPGFNPGLYLDPNDQGSSYYLRDYKRLFLTGGLNGDTNTTDTDHFDNAIILHEYAHFLEDVLSSGDSPGGCHNLNLIDPRLAWSEAWSNFFQGAVLNNEDYWDTVGNTSGSTGFINLISMESNSPEPDQATTAGEGEFREFAVTRFLWDALDTNVEASDTVSLDFKEIWNVLINPSGFNKTALAFQSAGAFHDYQISVGTTDLSSLRSAEGQPSDRSEYAQYLEPSGSCSPLNTITPVNNSGDTKCGNSGSADYDSSLLTSHLFDNNDFYHIYHSGGPIILTLSYATTAGSEANLDLFLYGEGYQFGKSDKLFGYKATTPDGNTGTTETQTISLSSLPAGNYIVNVHAVTYNGANLNGTTEYDLKLGGVALCPANL